MKHGPEKHYSPRIGWLRAAVMGANDGIVSTSSLIVGVASANAGLHEIVVAGTAGWVAGAMSMAAGEYVSVSSQADTERADLERERDELETNPEFERKELANIYVERGLDPVLAKQVAHQLMEKDALEAHARDELGMSSLHTARPLQAAWTSALTFSGGAALPLLLTILVPLSHIVAYVSVYSLLFLGFMGGLAARIGGAKVLLGAIRVTFWGALAMTLTASVGHLFKILV